MPWVGFEPTIPASERAKTVYALHGAAIVIGLVTKYVTVCRLNLHTEGGASASRSLLKLRVDAMHSDALSVPMIHSTLRTSQQASFSEDTFL
jgi:hypothetical protein